MKFQKKLEFQKNFILNSKKIEEKNWNSKKKIHMKFQIVGMLAKGIYSKYIICNLNTDILVVFLIPKK